MVIVKSLSPHLHRNFHRTPQDCILFESLHYFVVIFFLGNLIRFTIRINKNSDRDHEVSCSNFVCGRSMKRIAILLVSLLEWGTISASVTEPTVVLNKTKRTLADTATYGEKPAPLFYAIPDGTRPDFFATTKTFALAKSPYPAVFDPEVPKQVAAQQVLYEYQQTPTNAVSNVHVKQLFQPLETSEANNTPQFNQNNPMAQQQTQQQNNQNAHTSETVVNPVQHSSLVNHGQNYAHVQIQPYYPQHYQTHHYVPGRYFYVNGKYIYPPLPAQPHHPAQSQNQYQSSNNAPNQVNKPVSYITYGNTLNLPKQKLTPPPTGSPMNYNKFMPPQKQDIQPITKPVQSSPPKVREEVDEEEENSSVQKEDERNRERESSEEEDDDKSNYEEEDEENEDQYGKYFEDEEEDRGNYREEQEEDEEDDSDRKASRVVKVHKSPSRNKKNTPTKKRHNDKNNYAWSESYSHSSKYENGKKKSDKSKESKKYDTTKKAGKKNRNKPRKGNEKIEGRFSHNIPVIHEHNIFREKWYLSKSKNDRKH
ncbi:probable serine/threonine-protein kinase DDB_G0280133 [Coccinella septempunctata]|uniref:probable serine/threonine-protein kinase DDB_G0280133 n=1 Tax=Coccinella septempunctata TaxID=41139 RepID=UPI001D05CB63|nr:probable serine/threonine-protein kinase DDB_G0280133 [Coccinella septempunctata]